MNKQSAPIRFERIRAWFHPAEARLRSMYRLGYAAGQRATNAIPLAWRGERPTDSAPVPLLPAPVLIDGIAGGPHWDGKPGTWSANYTHPVAEQPEPKPAHLTPEQRRDVFSALATHPTRPEQLDTLLPERLRQNTPIPGVSEVAAIPTMHDVADWYPSTPQQHTDAIERLPIENGTTPLSPWQREEQHTGAFLLDNRDTLFEDVPPLGELLVEEETVARCEPGLYQIQMMARHKQKGE